MDDGDEPAPTQAALTAFYSRLRANSGSSEEDGRHLQALFDRANMTSKEVSILQGVLASYEYAALQEADTTL